VQVAVAVHVAQRRAQVQAQAADLVDREPPVAEQVLERLAVERLEDQHEARFLDGLVGAHDVRVRERRQQLALAPQPPARPLALPVLLAQRLGHAAAAALGAHTS